MDRRTFLKLAALSGAGLSFPGGLHALTDATGYRRGLI